MVVWLVLACVAAIFIALAIYPGELSWLSPKLHAHLYNGSAASYERKWLRHDYAAYDQLLTTCCEKVSQETPNPLSALDLCAGTGRATEVMAAVLPIDTHYVCVDASEGMLTILRSRLAASGLLSRNVQVFCDDAIRWLSHNEARFHVIAMMECSEFLPRFPDIVEALSKHLEPGAILVTTRPAGPFAWSFPFRAQRQPSYYRLFACHGFSLLVDVPWRGRYRLVAWRFHGN